MDELTRLVETEAIKRLKYRYMRCVDKKLWKEFEEVFVPEATASYSAGHYSYEGRDAIIAWLRQGMDRAGFHSSHTVHHPEIEFAGPNRATGVWSLCDYVVDTDHDITIAGAAFYEDEYVKRDDRWWILHTGYERTFEEMESRQTRPGLKLTASMWSTGGASSIKA